MTADIKDRLIAALRVYYYAGDEELNRLAENVFSDCASTQRENQFELEDILGGKVSLEDAPCDHKGSLEFIETSLMGDMTMETVALCKKCKKMMIIKGGIFTPITRGPQNEPRICA